MFSFLGGLEIGEEREFPGGPVVRTWCFHCHDLSSTPGGGTEILQATCCGQNFLEKEAEKENMLGCHDGILAALELSGGLLGSEGRLC